MKYIMSEHTNLPIMKKAVRVVRDMSDDTRIREAVRIREKALHDKLRLAGFSDEQINGILGA